METLIVWVKGKKTKFKTYNSYSASSRELGFKNSYQEEIISIQHLSNKRYISKENYEKLLEEKSELRENMRLLKNRLIKKYFPVRYYKEKADKYESLYYEEISKNRSWQKWK
jgi:hypothetical protein